MDYTALIDAWQSVTQPPSGVTGTALVGGMTTDEKIAAVNGWTVVGPARRMVIPTYEIYNAIDISEFNALTEANKQLIRDILSMGTVDASPGTQVRAQIVAVFPSGNTITSLAALAAQYDTTQVLWVNAQGGAGLTGSVDRATLQAAGGLT